MKTSVLGFDLPQELIAVRPAEPRDGSRLMVVSRSTSQITHTEFSRLPNHLQSGDVLVVNDSQVVPARLVGRRVPTGGKVELLLDPRPIEQGVRRAMVTPSKFARVGSMFVFGDNTLTATVLREEEDCLIRFHEVTDASLDTILDSLGSMPLPPYILKRRKHLEDHHTWNDREWYQSMFASHAGSIAAPTASLHFTPKVMAALAHRHVEVVPITLHVGKGTFLPIRMEDLDDHRMLPESFRIPSETTKRLVVAKQEGRRCIAVGTTVTRTLESAGLQKANTEGSTDLFIRPGFQFSIIDGLLTNFHLPSSTPLALVSALAGWDRVRVWYEEAVKQRYRWLSYGDAMLILP